MSESDKLYYYKMKADPGRYAAYLERKRQSNKRRPKHESERKRKWRAANPETADIARKANHAVDMALKHGILERARWCSRCGAKDVAIEGHHPSYAEQHWLCVIWVCSLCHAKEHHPPVGSVPAE